MRGGVKQEALQFRGWDFGVSLWKERRQSLDWKNGLDGIHGSLSTHAAGSACALKRRRIC